MLIALGGFEPNVSPQCHCIRYVYRKLIHSVRDKKFGVLVKMALASKTFPAISVMMVVLMLTFSTASIGNAF